MPEADVFSSRAAACHILHLDLMCAEQAFACLLVIAKAVLLCSLQHFAEEASEVWMICLQAVEAYLKSSKALPVNIKVHADSAAAYC